MDKAKDTTQPKDQITDSDISAEERELLNDSMENATSQDNTNLKRSELDNTDEDGELLNEISMSDDISGDGLDVPGAELDDANEKIGAEDEENNNWSQSDTD